MSAPKIGFVSLGCPKALVDSERIITQLRHDGYEVAPDYNDASLVVVNTCGFIDSAKQESLDAIGEAMTENGKVIVTGCMGNDKAVIDSYPNLLSVSGPHQYEQVVGAVRQHAPYEHKHDPKIDLVPPQGVKLTPRHYAYLKISEGCNHRCSFCIIPALRGDLVSRPIGEVMDEAEGLVKSGVKELLVISQDTSAYGVDIKYRTGFWQGKPVKTKMQSLCETLGELGVWVRLHYVYPYPHVDNAIQLMADGKILPYLDIPFQHSSFDVLKAMKRPAHSENVLERIQKWRNVCPDITLRSTFIVGFPGETDKDFDHLLNWLDEAQLDRVGCFQYSEVDGATSNALPNHVPADVKQERWERLMEAQQKISANKLQQKVGKTLSVLIDEVDEEGAIGRSKGDAPEIDGVVYLNGEQNVKQGDVVEVLVENADEYDLWGSLV